MKTEDILSFIPQREPFVLIDKLLQATEMISITSFQIPENHVLVENGLLTESGLVENMAQTAAAGTGFTFHQKGIAPPVGFIGALKNLTIVERPPIGSIIQTEVKFLNQVLNAHLVEATIQLNQKIIATCELKIFLQTESPNS
ncbi:MAG: 3-hydroxyacyl-ACP dehydratase [Bacteroidetes bacterium]|nr:3-hydroxyacyl-ACP dehydratase [Bacteroidota bacterium]MBS1739968.1 3-hydroxyacyl-ACP dehydratase [Bacteroidota bacterium]MBS1777614.1 3-hydroxyacyl-ACP dehydratase [Bacteroidota bacterium]